MDIYQELTNLQKSNTPFVIVTVVDKEGHAPQIPGAKMVVGLKDRLFGTIGGGAIELLAIKEAVSMLEKKESPKLQKYLLGEKNDILDSIETGMVCGGKLTLFFESHAALDTIYIFGAGHVGQALVYHLSKLDFRIVVCDCRNECSNAIPGADEVVIADYSKILEDKAVPENSFFLIATHSHEFDFTVLRRIYKSKWTPKYIGAIASKKKAETVLKRLSDEGLISNIDINKLYCPVGLKIGGTTPHEIAISIIAEILSVKFEKTGNSHSRTNLNSTKMN
ncbi:MAG: XdhC family protein [Lentisphaerota bacterium]